MDPRHIVIVHLVGLNEDKERPHVGDTLLDLHVKRLMVMSPHFELLHISGELPQSAQAIL